MNAAILTIGDELLQGFTVDTNSSWISRKLLPYQVRVIRKITIGDHLEDIKNSMRMLMEENCELIFVTGGLGPTHDDITKHAFRQLFDTDEYFDDVYFEELRQRFADRGFGEIPESNRTQATLLTGCDSIPNTKGTALGMHFLHQGKHIFIMPGVPVEMKGMITNTVIPDYLPPKSDLEIVSLNTTGVPESRLYGNIEDILEQFKDHFSVAFLPHHTGVNIRIRKNPAGSRNLSEISEQISNRLGTAVYGRDDDKLVRIVAEMLTKRDLTVAAAESCTGGMIGKWLTDQPGSSQYFLGGIIAYSNEMKIQQLNVPADTIGQFGAVSAQTAEAMASGVRKLCGADIGISATGISGPDGGTDEKPVGLVYIGLSDRSGTASRKFHFFRNRNLHREMTTQAALNMIRLKLLKQQQPSE